MVKKNVIKDMHCKVCGGNYCCSSDFGLHLRGIFHKNVNLNPVNHSEGKLTPNDLNKLPWKAFRSGKGWGINIKIASYLLVAINNGNTTIGDYKYYVCAEGKLIGRSLTRQGCF